MRAAVLVEEGRVAVVNRDPPRLEDTDQVLIRVVAVGVCGSEVHAYQGTHPYRTAPVVLGHEMAGVVTDVGSTVTNLTPGDRVTVDPQWTCGACAYCESGLPHLCVHKRVLGTPVWPGAFAEQILAPAEAVYRLPDTLSFAEGCLIEPLTVATHVVRRSGLRTGERVAVLGTGSIGGLVAGVCAAEQAGLILGADIHQHCLDTAIGRLGATHGYRLATPGSVDLGFVNEVARITDDEGVDVIFVTADDPALVTTAVQIAKPRGRIVLVALITEHPFQLTAYDILAKELTLLGSLMATPDDVRRALAYAASRRIDVAAILTHRLPIEQAQRGMELARTKADGAIKVVLQF
jgi:L-iditol 2-dehydrogenase